tara:strand:- start:543 stop:1283 length:741 start_codon:yes stop_codon:yes gene_type:complete
MINTKTKILGYDVLTNGIDFKSLLKNKNEVITCINPEAYLQAKKDDLFRKALLNSNHLLVDGVGIKIAAKWIYKKKIKRYTGPDFHQDFLKFFQKNGGGKVFYMGSSNSTLNRIKKRIKSLYDKIKVETFSPPFKKEFSVEDDNIIINAINNYNPDVLFVGLTCPKQEKWVEKNKNKLNVKLIASIGAEFDFFAQTKKRAPEWMSNNGLQWFHRFLSEPRRMAKRVFISDISFFLMIVKKTILKSK